MNHLERKLSAEELELVKSMRPFARFQPAEEHDKLVAGMVEELRLRKRVEELKLYKEKGVKTLPVAGEKESEPEASGEEGEQPRSARLSERQKRKIGRDKVAPLGNDDPTAIEVEHAPGGQKLSEEERTMCAALRLLPQQYNVIKHQIIREAAQTGCLKQGGGSQPLTIDVHKVGRSYDLFIKSQPH